MANFDGDAGGDYRAANQVGEEDQSNRYVGNGGNDSLYGGNLADALYGDALNGTVPVTDGNDDVRGGDGADTIFGGGGQNYLIGDEGDDEISCGDGSSVLDGGAGDDLLQAFTTNAASRTNMNGGQGDDILVMGVGQDIVDGFTGDDYVSYIYIEAGVTVNLATGKGAGGAAGDTYRSVENVSGTRFGDRIVGNGAYNDLFGFLGNDTIAGGAGGDYLDGSSDVDTLDYAASDAGVTIDLATGAASGGDAQGDSFVNFEGVSGTAFRDVLNGSAVANRLSGQAGDDSLAGKAGNDTLSGGLGADKLLGGAGLDKLAGGLGADRFMLTLAADSPAAAAARDQILDFSRAEGDRVDVSGVDANTEAAGNQAFSFIGTAGFGGVSGQIRVVRSGDDIVAFGDVNGDRVSDFGIAVLDAASLAAGDFIL